MTGAFKLHHNNAPSDTALSVCKFLARKCIPLLPHSPYSPDLSHCAFYLFPKLKLKAKGCHFQIFSSVQKAVIIAFKTLTEADF
jgi:hypothetical protein